MKKYYFALSLVITLVLLSVSVSYSGYIITQITDNSYHGAVGDGKPKINDNGYVVWVEDKGSEQFSNYEIFLYDGMNITQLTNNSYDDWDPQINDNGYVVWSGWDGSDSEIFLYNGIATTQLTNNSYNDDNPQINNNGYVVWVGSDGSDSEIFLYNGITISQLTDNSYGDTRPQINNNGYVVWYGGGSFPQYWEIFLYDGTTISQLTDNSYADMHPKINNNGYVVWQGSPNNNRGAEIFLYNGSDVIKITNISYLWLNDSIIFLSPQINDNGYVVWHGFDRYISGYVSEWEIFLYNGTGIIQLTDHSNGEWGLYPQINDNGYVVWRGTESYYGGNEIFLYDGTNITQITSNSFEDEDPQINNKGYIVWEAANEIFLAKPCTFAGTPNLISPSNGTIGVSLMPTLDWSEVSSATSYDAQVCSDSGCSSVVCAANITSSEWTVSPTLDHGVTYYWRVQSKNACADSSWTDTWSFTVLLVKPNPPSQLSAKTTSSSSIILTWKDNSTNETGFKIERKTGTCDSANTWKQIAKKGANVITHTNSGLAPNTTYSYRVRAYNADGNSSYSNCASGKTALSGTPKAPTNLNATSISTNQIKLIWTDNSTDETSFKVYRKVGAGSWGLFSTKDPNVVSHTDTTVSGNTTATTYSYYVKACNSSGCSPSTNSAVVPYQPTNLSATAVSSSQINLTWTDTSSNETGFQVYRKSGDCLSMNSWGKIATTDPNTPSYSNTGLSSGMTYSYRVRAYKRSSAQPYAYGYSSYSNCSSATTP